AVDVEVETGAEEVLVIARAHTGRDERGRAGLRSRGDSGRVEGARELRVARDRSVKPAEPVRGVLVIADRRDRRDHEPARTANVGRAAAPVEVLPQDAGVLIVHADGVAGRSGGRPA